MAIAASLEGYLVFECAREFLGVVTGEADSDTVLLQYVGSESNMGGVTLNAAVIFGNRRVLDSL